MADGLREACLPVGRLHSTRYTLHDKCKVRSTKCDTFELNFMFMIRTCLSCLREACSVQRETNKFELLKSFA